MGPDSVFKVLYELTLMCFAVLVGTGIYLFFFYRYVIEGSFDDLYPVLVTRPSVALGLEVQRAHRWASYVFIVLGSVTALVGLLSSRTPTLDWARRRRAVLVALPILALIGRATGERLAWTQLALMTVEVGSNIRGFLWIFGDRVRFVLVGDRIIQLEPFATALVVHVVAITGLVGAVLFLGRPGRRMLTPVYELDSSEM